MHEIDCIHIKNANPGGMITGLSYHCCSDTLMVSFANTVVEVDKKCETARKVCSIKSGWITSVLSLCPGIILTTERDQQQYVEIRNPCGELTACALFGDCFLVRNLIFNPCQPCCASPQIEAFVLKNYRYPFLCDLDFPLGAMGFVPRRCNFDLCRECCCVTPCKSKDPCADMIESIAYVEAALSHILNAEGEKLQKVIAETDDIETILQVNREVNKTIVNATHLEHVLYAKLAALADGDLCRDPCHRHQKYS